jgi:ribosomal protein S18 acetylase RimI-like enzyme
LSAALYLERHTMTGMTGGAEIREARPDEYGSAGEVSVAGYREFYGVSLGSYEDQLRNVVARAAWATILVAVAGGRVLGTVSYVGDAGSELATRFQMLDEGSIRMLAVAPDCRRRGIGRALSEACITRARAEGKRRVVLHADETMTAARDLYEGLGFKRDPGRDFTPDVTWLVCYVLDL